MIIQPNLQKDEAFPQSIIDNDQTITIQYRSTSFTCRDCQHDHHHSRSFIHTYMQTSIQTFNFIAYNELHIFQVLFLIGIDKNSENTV
jgi:hypothetical protein